MREKILKSEASLAQKAEQQRLAMEKAQLRGDGAAGRTAISKLVGPAAQHS